MNINNKPGENLQIEDAPFFEGAVCAEPNGPMTSHFR